MGKDQGGAMVQDDLYRAIIATGLLTETQLDRMPIEDVETIYALVLGVVTDFLANGSYNKSPRCDEPHCCQRSEIET